MGANDNKKVIKIVAAIALAYVVVLGGGLSTGDKKEVKAPTEDTADEWKKKHVPEWANSLSFLPAPKFNFSKSEIVLTKGKPQQLKAGGSQKYDKRKASIRLVEGSPVTIRFISNGPDEPQELTLAEFTSKDFVVGELGGVFTFALKSGDSARLRLL